METAPIVLAFVGLAGTWTLTVALFSWWLSAQFTRLEKMIHKLLQAHKDDMNRHISSMEKRLLSCELRLFGFGPIVIDQSQSPNHDDT